MTALRVSLLLTILMLASSANADFKRDYGTGLKALQDGDYQRAVSEFEKAIADNPKSAARVRIYGMRFEPYMPHYYIGNARFQLGDCAGAVAAWEEAERQGVVQSQDMSQSLAQNKSQCSASIVDVSGIAAAARQALDDLTQSVKRLEDLGGDSRLSSDWQKRDAWRSALAQGKRWVGDLSSRIDSAEADKNADAIEQASVDAQSENAQIQQTLNAVTTRLAEVEREQSQERIAREANQARTDLIRATASIRASLNEGIRDPQVTSLARELLEFSTQSADLQARANTDAGQYRSLTRNITGKIREYRQAVQDFENRQQDIARRTPPDSLKLAAEAYFAGQYDQAAKIADPGAFSDPRAQLQAHLFRAAARYNLYVLAGQNDSALLQQARSDIRSIKRLDQKFSPYIAAFSPKFMSLFESTL